jgi:hypothetical protein
MAPFKFFRPSDPLGSDSRLTFVAVAPASLTFGDPQQLH